MPLVLAIFGAAITLAPAKPRLPDWVAQAIQGASGGVAGPNGSDRTSVKAAPAIVLLDESHITVRPDGARHVHTRFAVRIDNVAAARDRAVARVQYKADRRRKPVLTAWLLSPNGEVKEYGRREYVDVADARHAIVTDSRMLAISAERDVQPGAVFAWEAESDEAGLFLQHYWGFQQREPVVRSTLTVDVPAGWTARTITFNHPPITPRQSGTRYTWELMNLPGVKPEEHGPSPAGLAAFIGIDVVPGGDHSSLAHNGGEPWTWEALSRYFIPIYDEKARPTPEIAARARELVKDAPTPWERIQRIGDFVQDVNYVSIQLDLSRGGGFAPRAAADTLAHGYGDCKDKTTLMRSLLKAVGIASYPVVSCATDRRYVRAEWPSPSVFNHCIIAIGVDETVESPSIINHERLGRLLVFDPTDPFTALGSLLPAHQGANVLLIAGGEGGLVRLPFDTPADNRVDRTVTAALTPSGAVVARVEETYLGASAARQRARRRQLSPADYTKFVTERLAPTLGAVRLGDIAASEADGGARFDLRVELGARNYAKAMRDKLLILKPVIVARRETVGFDGEKRTQAIFLEPEAYTETTRIAVPEGFSATDLPEPVRLADTWGEYSASCRVENGQVIHERALAIRATELPAAEHQRVRTFFQRIFEAEQTPVVLERQQAHARHHAEGAGEGAVQDQAP